MAKLSEEIAAHERMQSVLEMDPPWSLCLVVANQSDHSCTTAGMTLLELVEASQETVQDSPVVLVVKVPRAHVRGIGEDMVFDNVRTRLSKLIAERYGYRCVAGPVEEQDRSRRRQFPNVLEVIHGSEVDAESEGCENLGQPCQRAWQWDSENLLLRSPEIDYLVQIECRRVEDDSLHPVRSFGVVEEADGYSPTHTVSNQDDIFRPGGKGEHHGGLQVLPLFSSELIVPAGTRRKPCIVPVGDGQSRISTLDEYRYGSQELAAVRALPMHEYRPCVRFASGQPGWEVSQSGRDIDLPEIDPVRRERVPGVRKTVDADIVADPWKGAKGYQFSGHGALGCIDDSGHLVIGIR